MNDNTERELTSIEQLRLEMDVRRALLEEAVVPDVHAEFEAFSQRTNTEGSRHHTRLVVYATLAAAACIAVLLLLARHTPVQTTDGLVVFKATPGNDTDVSLIVDKQPLSLHAPAAREQGVTISQSGEIHITPTTEVDDDDVTTLLIPQGKVARLLLEDGTRVCLSAASRLIFPRRFPTEGKREVALIGEGFFEVATDSLRPFVVNCGKLSTTVLGTAFNIRNFQDEQACVTLLSGSVTVENQTAAVKLNPEEEATLGDDGIHIAKADVDVTTSWMNGEFFFNGQTMRHIMIEIGRWYNRDVVFVNTAHLDDRLHFSCSRDKSLSEVLRQLQLISGANISEKEGSLVVF